jgi:hypothetical protein
LPADEFAGVWWDTSRDRVSFVLAVTQRVDEHTIAVRRLVEHPQQVDVVERKRSEQALGAIRDELVELWHEFPIAMISADPRAGVVVVGFSRDNSAARVELEQRFGDAIRFEPGHWFGRAV